jgi:hypothetical protein
VPNLLEIGVSDWQTNLRYLAPGHGEIDEMMAGVDFYEDGHPVQLLTGVSREQAAFMEQVAAGRMVPKQLPVGIERTCGWPQISTSKSPDKIPRQNAIVPVGSPLVVTFTSYVPQ